MIFNTVVRDQLILGHIYGIGLDADSVLRRSCGICGEWGNVTLAVLIFQCFGLSLGDKDADIKIDNLAAFVSCRFILSFWQRASIYGNFLDQVRFGNWFKSGTDMTLLST